MSGITGGVAYYPDHWPQEEWERDLRLIRESGLSCIRFGEFSWNWFEPGENRFDFEKYDLFMDYAYEAGFKVILCTPTAAPPEWFLKKYPDALMLDSSGRPHPSQRHMVCFNHPEFLRIAENTITHLAEHYKKHPALEGWQIDNEPTLGESAARDRLYDYNPHTSRLFVKYLQEKYQNDLEQLNSAWYNNFWSRSYTQWDQIQPPVQPGNPSHWLEWMRFRENNVTGYIQWQRKLLKSIDMNFTIGLNIPECGPLASAALGQDYWKQAEGMDYIGTDIYCYVKDMYWEEKSAGYCCDLIRSAAQSQRIPFWISETQGGPHLSPWRFNFFDGVWDVQFLEDSLCRYVEHGAERVLFFLWRPCPGGREFGMNGLVHMDGTPSRRSAAIAGILERAGTEEFHYGSRPPAYIHYSKDSLKLALGFDPDHTADESYHGWYNLLTDCGYRVEFLDDEALAEKSWSKDEILVLPHSFAMDEKTANAVRTAASAGIKVLAGYGTGFYNEYGCCNKAMPGFGLDGAFGFRLQAVDFAAESVQPEIEGLKGVKIGSHRGVTDIKDASVLALASGGEPLLLKNQSIYYFAFDLGEVYLRTGLNREVCRWFVYKITM